ncbi:MAG: hypothetical protein QGF00_13140 [Planctomycetota bacterium]|jgi:alpha-galactosidase|nr:hypothetical protein [Planctomycetota bacterium]MDP7250543.1 hypothetical protein [Planctomycetota bacterium]
MAKKIVCLGGGAFYFKNVIKYFPVAETLRGSEIVLYDINEERAKRVAALGQRLADEAGTGLTMRGTADLADAVDGVDFAVGGIGGAGSEASRSIDRSFYHQADMRIPAKYGIHQLIGDTGGPAAMMMGFRSVAAYLEMCREMERRAPSAILLNHSNPMAVICRALTKYTDIKVFGICHGVQIGIGAAAGILEVPPEELDCVWVGTNHYYWFTKIVHKGRDVYPELRRRIAERQPSGNQEMSRKLSEIYGYNIVYQSDDHIAEFYPFLAGLPGGQSSLPEAMAQSAWNHAYDENEPMPDGPDDSPEAMAKFTEDFQAELDKVELPSEMSNPLRSESVVSLIDDICAGRRNVHILNTANEGAIPNLPRHALVEVETVTDSTGARVVHMDEAPVVLKGMLEKRFAWQELVADAAVTGDRNLAMQALMLDEMAIFPDKAEPMLDELLEASRALLPQFFT